MPLTSRWKIFSILSAMYVLAYFYRVSMAVAARDLATDLGLSANQLGVLSGAFFYAFALSQIPLGPLLDRFGGRTIISIMGLLTTAGSFVFGMADSYAIALSGRVLMGAGSACVLMGALKVFGNWYSAREFATVSGLIVAVGNLGNLAATAPLASAISLSGWRQPFITVGFIQAATVLVMYLVVRDHPAEVHPSSASHTDRLGLIAGWRAVFTTGSFWLLSLLSFFWYAAYMAVQGMWGGPYLMEALRLSRQEAGTLLMCTSIGFILGCLVIGRISTSIIRSRKWTLVAGQALLLGLTSLLLGPVERMATPLLPVVFLAIGLAVSSGVTIYPMIREMFPSGITATAMTAVNFFVLMGAATVQQVMGLLIERHPRGVGGYPPEAYHEAFMVPVIGLAVALFAFLFIRDTRPAEK
jgi:sugar phosphate permease